MSTSVNITVDEKPVFVTLSGAQGPTGEGITPEALEQIALAIEISENFDEVDNTRDAVKPVSGPQAEAIAEVAAAAGTFTLQTANNKTIIFDSTGKVVERKDKKNRSFEGKAGLEHRAEVPELYLPTLTLGDYREITFTSDGKVLYAVTNGGARLRASGGYLIPDNANEVPSLAMGQGDYVDITRDHNGNFIRGRKRDGSYWVAENGQEVEDLRLPSLRQKYAPGGLYMGTTSLTPITNIVYLILFDGQSHAAGGNADPADFPVTTDAPFPNNAFMVGDQPWHFFGKKMLYLSPLKEVYEGSPTGGKETVCSGVALALLPALQERLGFMPKIIFASVAAGGNAYAGGADARNGMKRGSDIYEKMLDTVRSARDLARRTWGARLIVLGRVTLHGEQDFADGTSQGMYGRYIDNWGMDADADIKAITRQTDPVRNYISQVNRGSSTVGVPVQVAQAQLEAEDRNPLVRCIGPRYFCEKAGPDGAHFSSRSLRRLGLQIGSYLLKDLFGAGARCLRTFDHYWEDSLNYVILYTGPVDLETDDSKIVISTLGVGKGVDFIQRGGAGEAITAISKPFSNTIRLTFDQHPTGSRQRLNVACRVTGSGANGNVEGARSGIRSASPLIVDTGLDSFSDGFSVYDWAATETIYMRPF